MTNDFRQRDVNHKALESKEQQTKRTESFKLRKGHITQDPILARHIQFIKNIQLTLPQEDEQLVSQEPCQLILTR